MKIKELREYGRCALKDLSASERILPVPSEIIQMEVDLLIAQITNLSRVQILCNELLEVSEEESEQIKNLFVRRANYEPIAYILGSKSFRNIDLVVSKGVLIPRPETELLVEQACQQIKLLYEKKSQENSTSKLSYCIIDLGTGSGAIICSIVEEVERLFGKDILEQGLFYAVDISPEALEIAKKNIFRLGYEKLIKLLPGDIKDINLQNLLFPNNLLIKHLCLDDEKQPLVPSDRANYDLVLILSNPPYIPANTELPEDVQKFEPEIALRSGEDGLCIIKRLFRIYLNLLEDIQTHNEWTISSLKLLFEFGDSQSKMIYDYAQTLRIGNLDTPLLDKFNLVFHRDLAGKERVADIG